MDTGNGVCFMNTRFDEKVYAQGSCISYEPLLTGVSQYKNRVRDGVVILRFLFFSFGNLLVPGGYLFKILNLSKSAPANLVKFAQNQ